MASNEVNSMTGRKQVNFKEKQTKQKKKAGKKEEIVQHGQPVEPEHMLEVIWHLNLSNLNLSVGREGFGPGHDKRLNLAGI